MPIEIDQLRAAANRPRTRAAGTLSEAKSAGMRTAFVCHSHHDAPLVIGLAHILSESGWRVYVDWLDEEMPSAPNRETAQRIKAKIVDHDYFLFLATKNSMGSRWCPWEIGYADGKKELSRILIVPTVESGKTHGSEYLQLYRRVDFSTFNDLRVWDPGQSSSTTFVKSL